MNLAKTWLILLVLFSMFHVTTVQASAVTDGLKTTIDSVINVVTDPKYKEDRNARRQKLRTIISPKFNYEEMGKRSLGAKWKSLSPDEKKQFLSLFEKLLENSYASKIESYQDEKINYNEEIIKGKYAMVKTEVVRRSDSVEVDYKLLKTESDWQVYDFIIAGVSMVRNYRTQFSKVIRKESIKGLIEKMKEKIDELNDGSITEENL